MNVEESSAIICQAVQTGAGLGLASQGSFFSSLTHAHLLSNAALEALSSALKCQGFYSLAQNLKLFCIFVFLQGSLKYLQYSRVDVGQKRETISKLCTSFKHCQQSLHLVGLLNSNSPT